MVIALYWIGTSPGCLVGGHEGEKKIRQILFRAFMYDSRMKIKFEVGFDEIINSEFTEVFSTES